MNRPAFVLLLSVSLLTGGAAHARAVAYDFKQALRFVSPSIVVPPEWDGIWTTVDSVYDCASGFRTLATGADTLCSGQVFNEGGALNFSCTGTADATSFHAHCTGSELVFPDCTLMIDIQVDGVLTGDTYRSVTTTNTSYSGTGSGCDLLPADCTRSVTYGTRTGPAPSAYCITSVKRTTWGQLKVSYR